MSALESSITLDDVFAVVEAKRVPLAPELAGYLALEIADGADAGGGDVDPKTVFVSEEGTVALVRPKRDPNTGDAEASVRRLLAKLLEASGSGTPALSTAAKRKPGNGLPALVEELEAALIPVNRAAGRRAMARLARETKRVLLGVGRNANAAPVAAKAEPKAAASLKPVASAAPHARPLVRKKPSEAPPEGARSLAPEGARSLAPEARPATREPEESVSAALDGLESLPRQAGDERGGVHDAVTVDPGAVALPPRQKVAAPPATGRGAGGIVVPPSERGGLRPPARRVAGAAAVPAPSAEPGAVRPGSVPELFGGDEVDSLLDSFNVSDLVEDNKQVARDLKAMAGLEPTPPPPDAEALAAMTRALPGPRVEASSAGENTSWNPPPPLDGDSVEALLALADASAPPPAIAARRSELDAPPPSPSPPLTESQLGRRGAGPVSPAPQPIKVLSDSQLTPKGQTGPVAARSLSDSQLARKEQNLPPSPLFGGAAGAAALAAGAPAALRQSHEDLPAPPASSRGAEAPSPADAKASGARPRLADSAPASRRKPAAAPAGRRAPKTGFALLVVTLVVLASATAAIWKFAPQVFTGHPKAVATAPSASPAPSAAPPPACKVSLVLSDVPAGAEILLRVGQAPVDVERMPVGTRLELVGTAEGQAPKRTVIRAETAWDKGPDGKPRIEVPIQLDPSKAKPGTPDPWPPAEPGSQVGGSGAPGTVHVVSNVRGAEVWLLAGLGPEARIDQLRCDGDIDVLLAGGPTTDTKTPLRKRLHVSEKDIAASAADPKGNKLVAVSAKEH